MGRADDPLVLLTHPRNQGVQATIRVPLSPRDSYSHSLYLSHMPSGTNDGARFTQKRHFLIRHNASVFLVCQLSCIWLYRMPLSMLDAIHSHTCCLDITRISMLCRLKSVSPLGSQIPTICLQAYMSRPRSCEELSEKRGLGFAKGLAPAQKANVVRGSNTRLSAEPSTWLTLGQKPG